MIDCILLVLNGQLMPVYTDFLTDPELRYNVGWVQVALIFFTVIYCAA